MKNLACACFVLADKPQLRWTEEKLNDGLAHSVFLGKHEIACLDAQTARTLYVDIVSAINRSQGKD